MSFELNSPCFVVSDPSLPQIWSAIMAFVSLAAYLCVKSRPQRLPSDGKVDKREKSPWLPAGVWTDGTFYSCVASPPCRHLRRAVTDPVLHLTASLSASSSPFSVRSPFLSFCSTSLTRNLSKAISSQPPSSTSTQQRRYRRQS
jgi:hypothetical protein